MWLNGTWVLPSFVKVSWVICMILSPSVTLKRRLGVHGGSETWREWLHGPSEVSLIYLCVHACKAWVQAGVCEYRRTRVTQRTTSGIDRHLSPYMKHNLFCCSPCAVWDFSGKILALPPIYFHASLYTGLGDPIPDTHKPVDSLRPLSKAAFVLHSFVRDASVMA